MKTLPKNSWVRCDERKGCSAYKDSDSAIPGCDTAFEAAE